MITHFSLRTALNAALVAIGVLTVTPVYAQDQAALEQLIPEKVKDAASKEGEIVVIRNNWVTQEVSAVLVHKLLQAMHVDAKLVTMDSNAMWPAMARADNMLQVNYWPPTMKRFVEKYIDQDKTVISAGNTGYSGIEGWYFPTYVMKGDPARGIKPACPGLPDWKALNECVEVFRTASTGEKGRYLSGDKAWEPNYGDYDRMKNLQLNYEMEFAGSEAALVAEWKRAIDRGEPILALMWTPHFVPSRYDVTRVEFPPYSDECWNTTHACQWEDAPVFKAASAGFPEKHPVVYKFFEQYVLTDAQIGELIIAVEGGKTVDEAVTDWLGTNEAVWTRWIPKTAGE